MELYGLHRLTVLGGPWVWLQNMIVLLHNMAVKMVDQLRVYPLTTAILSVSLSLALLNAIVKDFLLTLHKRPAHFMPSSWSVVLRRPTANVPLVEVGRYGDISETLAHGSKLVSTCVTEPKVQS